jgi:Fic family protein
LSTRIGYTGFKSPKGCGLFVAYDEPGKFRYEDDYSKTFVGHAKSGGTYTPPKIHRDILLLMKTYIEWLEAFPISDPLIKAPLAHYYFELIHPFKDGNGRVGRLIEAFIMDSQANGYRYAKSIAKYYLDHISSYFRLFNECRKNATNKGENKKFPNQAFVEFFARGMIDTINRLHDRTNNAIGEILVSSSIEIMYADKKMNHRQYAVLKEIWKLEAPLYKSTLDSLPAYRAIYEKFSKATKRRDLKTLEKLNLIRVLDDDQILCIKIQPSIKLSEAAATQP